mmetsp:Transcript_18588/g.57138  ORF Transcript_18588/g.57138 Transcript_18588/m.57138 type:complete len:488 (+) Transcript_18588:31-1494(+)
MASSSSPPPQVLKFGILGLESENSRAVAEALERSGKCELVAVAGSNTEEWCAAEDFDKKAVKQYASYDRMLKDDTIDAVYVGVPTRLRRVWSVAAAQNKKHVLAEKPLGRSAEEALEVMQACERNEVLLMDAVAFAHHARSRAIVTRLRDERGFGSSPSRCDASVSFAAKPQFLKAMRTKEREDDPLGVVGDLGWFCAKWGLLAFGNAATPVTASARARWQTDFSSQEDEDRDGPPLELTGTVEFDGGQQLQLHCSYVHAFRQRLEVCGNGSKVLRCDDFLYPELGPSSNAAFHVCTYADPPLHDLDGLVVSADQTHREAACDQITAMLDAFADLALFKRGDDGGRHAWARAAFMTQVIVNALLDSAKLNGQGIAVETPTLLLLEDEEDKHPDDDAPALDQLGGDAPPPSRDTTTSSKKDAATSPASSQQKKTSRASSSTKRKRVLDDDDDDDDEPDEDEEEEEPSQRTTRGRASSRKAATRKGRRH